MKIGLIDVDGHNYPNLARMKISAWHKAKGDTVGAVEVVRCKDCKHRYSDSWCEYVDDDNFYCVRGERKDGAD